MRNWLETWHKPQQICLPQKKTEQEEKQDEKPKNSKEEKQDEKQENSKKVEKEEKQEEEKSNNSPDLRRLLDTDDEDDDDNDMDRLTD